MSVFSRFDPARPASALMGAVVIGVLAGLVSAAFLSITGEPSIEDAIAIEEANARAADHTGATGHEEAPEVSREVQRGPGLFGAYALAGAAFGALFGVTFLGLRKRLPDLVTRALVVGAVLAGAITVSPWLKYPPNPPAVGDPATLSQRQTLYATVIVLTLVVLLVAAALSARLRSGGWVADQRLLLVAAAVVVPMALIYALMPPPPDEIAVPATLLWRFRIAALAGNLLLWGVLAFGFAAVAAAADRRTRHGVLATR
ncbi:MAG: CbtA family protein [Acidimicrobiia bacterium]